EKLSLQYGMVHIGLIPIIVRIANFVFSLEPQLVMAINGDTIEKLTQTTAHWMYLEKNCADVIKRYNNNKKEQPVDGITVKVLFLVICACNLPDKGI
ncbi:hypothetical protein Tco_1461059, partial [Tanacetum coccineum]